MSPAQSLFSLNSEKKLGKEMNMCWKKKRLYALIAAVKDTSRTGCDTRVSEKFSVTYAVSAATGFHSA
jgi:hypothetical protein